MWRKKKGFSGGGRQILLMYQKITGQKSETSITEKEKRVQ